MNCALKCCQIKKNHPKAKPKEKKATSKIPGTKPKTFKKHWNMSH